jgi:hypothetical protein
MSDACNITYTSCFILKKKPGTVFICHNCTQAYEYPELFVRHVKYLKNLRVKSDITSMEWRGQPSLF